MKQHTLSCIAFVLLSAVTCHAQSWKIGGNNAAGGGADKLFGIISPSNRNIVFVNGNLNGVPVERGRITSDGLWGIGTTQIGARLHVNSAVGETPFRVQINGVTKLYVNSNGGLGVGTTNTPPVNGILSSGNVSVGSGTFADNIKLQVINGADASINSGGFIVAGQTSSTNLAIDNNEIMARNNGAAATLYLNANGGDVNIGNGKLVVEDLNDAIGIKTAVPEADLHMKHGIGSGATNGFRIENQGASHNQWTMYVQNSNGNMEWYKNGSIRGVFDQASGAYSSISDMRMKKNIEAAGTLLPKIMQLKVKYYHFLNNADTDKKSYGMLAQEVDKIFPELVTHQAGDDGKEMFLMNYTAFGVLAIKGIQEQQQSIEALQAQAATIRQETEAMEAKLQELEKLLKTEGIVLSGNTSAHSKANAGTSLSLEQNTPNPFNSNTTIRYSLPANTSASIAVYSSSGVLVKKIPANNSGVVVMDAGNLAAGTYTYALVANGRTIASRIMVIAR